jgi:predicted O-methyltransferase YrrM
MQKADIILKKIENLSEKIFLPIVGPEKGEILARFIKKKKPKNILEIGTLIGYSAILMAKNAPQTSKIISIEINPVFAKIARKIVKKAGFDNIQIVVGDAKRVIPKLKEKFDFVLIDAVKEEYIDYLLALEPKLNSKAIIVADNAEIFADQMKDYLNYVRNSGKYRSKTYFVGEDALEVSIKLS